MPGERLRESEDDIRNGSALKVAAIDGYLQTRFQLDSGNLGIVAMKSSPPYGTRRAIWHGICIVLLRRKT